eukprot:CAMPEP_0171231298 /NCGR_PEP_ID=MMETSP0790-20130122/39831_1 /TAXON_ID=2925 /ORGANISM="Alexandrium catenella, Strain OF101" /LENGTH=329 /DNA_ID=CAMNT_0011697519 /DNA_START=73 /DNA_END=1062 /DNA_ORIENTATION=-
MASTTEITLNENTDLVIVKLAAAAKNSSVETVRESLKHLKRMFEGLNARYAQHRDLECHLIDLSSEYREIHGRAMKYVDEMKEFSKSAKDEYIPLLKEALNDRSLKNAELMLEELASHFDGVSVSFNEVVLKYEDTAKCIDKATGHAARLAREARRASESGQSMKDGGVRTSIVGGVLTVGGGIAAGAGSVVAAPVVIPSAVVAGIGAVACATGGGAVVHGQSTAEEQDRQTAMFESFNFAMQKVNKIVMDHKSEVLSIQTSLKHLARDNGNLRRLVDRWDGDAGDQNNLARYLKNTTDHFTDLEVKCDEFQNTDSKGFLTMAQALGYE